MIYKNISLKKYTTFKVGGYAKYFTEVSNTSELKKALTFASIKNINYFILGEGSNILIDDKGFAGLIIKFASKKISFKNNFVTADAGVRWDELVQKTVEKKLYGIECLSGIPGSVGASVVQNIGAFGQETKDVLESVKVFDTRINKIINLDNKKCEFEYRDSIFKHNKHYIVLSITLKLNVKNLNRNKYKQLSDILRNTKNPTSKKIRTEVLKLRNQKLDDVTIHGNAGSFFKNPVVNRKILSDLKLQFPDIPNYEIDKSKYKLFAGWLIDKAGLKGKSVSGAAVSTKNALVLINKSGCAKSSDIKKLAAKIQKDVEKKFGINLKREVEYVGY